MKIAIVCPYDWSKPGGVRAHVANLARYLQARHDVRILAPSSEPLARDGLDRSVVIAGRPVAVPYNRSVSPVALSPRVLRRTARLLREFEPHVVHVHEPLAPFASFAASARGPRPLVGTFHAWSDADRMYRLAGPALRRVARRLDVRIAVSPSAQAYAAEALKLPMGAFRIVPNGVDAEAFGAAKPLPELADPERPLLLFVGRLERRKGVDVLVRAFLRVRAENPRLRLCVVGEGPERERCQQMIPPALRPDALFVGAVTNEDLPRYHASADVFVSVATGGESFGIVLLEAMAAGLPVIASDIPGYRTVMRDGVQGRMVGPGDAVALADAIEALLENRRLREAMGAEGRRSAARHAWPVVGAELEEVYRDVWNRAR